MNDRIKSNRQERPDGMVLYRPMRNGPTYVLSKGQDAEIGKLVSWQIVVEYVAGIPMLTVLLSWLSGDLGLPAMLACVGVILTVATPIGVRLERHRKDIFRQAPVSETQIELPEVRHQLAQLWSIMPARQRFALRAAPFLILFSSGIMVLGHLFAGFLDRAPPLSFMQATGFFALSILLCWLVARLSGTRTPSQKG